MPNFRILALFIERNIIHHPCIHVYVKRKCSTLRVRMPIWLFQSCFLDKKSFIACILNFHLSNPFPQSISREQNLGTPKKKAKPQTPKKGLFGHLKPSTPRSMQSPGGPNVVRTTNFVQIANLPISIRSINKTHFTLDRVSRKHVF